MWPTVDGPSIVSLNFVMDHLSATGDWVTRSRKDMTVLVENIRQRCTTIHPREG